MQNPLALIFRAFKLRLQGRVHFLDNPENIKLEDRGEEFVAFRKVVVEPAAIQPVEPGATFRVRFRFKNLSARANRILSLIPIPLIMAQSGFRSKTWLLGARTGDFIGHYEFDTVETANAYWDSLPLRMMRRRAAPDSLTHEIHKI
jgi:hypothetical protein